jgi:hypothetical protein
LLDEDRLGGIVDEWSRRSHRKLTLSGFRLSEQWIVRMTPDRHCSNRRAVPPPPHMIASFFLLDSLGVIELVS